MSESRCAVCKIKGKTRRVLVGLGDSKVSICKKCYERFVITAAEQYQEDFHNQDQEGNQTRPVFNRAGVISNKIIKMAGKKAMKEYGFVTGASVVLGGLALDLAIGTGKTLIGSGKGPADNITGKAVTFFQSYDDRIPVKVCCPVCEGQFITCPVCEGDSFKEESVVCRACKGSKLKKCKYCSGKGRGLIFKCHKCEGGGSMSCKKCKGVGLVDVKIACAHCHGKGQIQAECTVCNSERIRRLD